jgi:hypothetical protein
MQKCPKNYKCMVRDGGILPNVSWQCSSNKLPTVTTWCRLTTFYKGQHIWPGHTSICIRSRFFTLSAFNVYILLAHIFWTVTRGWGNLSLCFNLVNCGTVFLTWNVLTPAIESLHTFNTNSLLFHLITIVSCYS